MPEYIKFPLVLAFICAISATALGNLHVATKDQIAASALKKVEAAFVEVAPNFNSSEKIEAAEFSYYKLFDKDGELIALAMKTGVAGYSSTVECVTAVNPKTGIVLRTTVVNSQETPGLGERIRARESKETWIDILTGKEGKADDVDLRNSLIRSFDNQSQEKLKLKSSGGEIDAFTGATISSEAVLDAVVDAVEALKTVLL